MIYPLVTDLADEGIPVVLTCRVLGFSKQAYFKWRAKPVSQRDWDDAHLINTAIDIHHDDPEFGYRFITDELAGKGVRASRNRVNRLCSAQRIWSVHSRKCGLNRRPGPPVHDDRVLRRFTAQRPNELWLTDITEHPTAEGKLYLCAVKDACSKRIVGYSMDSRMTADLAVRALQHAVALRGPAGTVVHSDRGSQGGLNRPSQHLEREVDEDGLRAEAEDGPRLPRADPVAGASDGRMARGPGAVLGRHRARRLNGRCSGQGRRVVPGRLPLVSPRWRREADAPAGGVRPLLVIL